MTLESTTNSLCGRQAARRDTVSELQELLEALDKARGAVQAQLDTHFIRPVGRRR